MQLVNRVIGKRRLVVIGCIPAVLALVSLEGCAGAGGGFGGGDCSINQTATDAVIGVAAGAGMGALLAKNRAAGALFGGAAGGFLGEFLGSQADQVCRQKAEQQALDAAVIKYQDSQRVAAAQPTATGNNTTTPTPQAVTRHKRKYPAAAAKPAPPPEPTYDQITWNASSGATGTIAPEHVYTDTASNSICTTRQESLKDSSGSPVLKTVKSCRDQNGHWVDA